MSFFQGFEGISHSMLIAYYDFFFILLYGDLFVGLSDTPFSLAFFLTAFSDRSNLYAIKPVGVFPPANEFSFAISAFPQA